MCCDTDGSGMHRLLCEPEPCLVRDGIHCPSDTGAECHTDARAIGHTDCFADVRAERSADGGADGAADDFAGLWNEADDAAERDPECEPECGADTSAELVADTRADEDTIARCDTRADGAHMHILAAGVLCGMQRYVLPPGDHSGAVRWCTVRARIGSEPRIRLLLLDMARAGGDERKRACT